MFRNSLRVEQNRIYTNSDIHSILKTEEDVLYSFNKPLTNLAINTFDLVIKVVEKLQICNKYCDKNEMLCFISYLVLLLEDD